MVVNDSQKTQKAGMDVPPPEKNPETETLSVHSVFKIVYFLIGVSSVEETCKSAHHRYCMHGRGRGQMLDTQN